MGIIYYEKGFARLKKLIYPEGSPVAKNAEKSIKTNKRKGVGWIKVFGSFCPEKANRPNPPKTLLQKSFVGIK